MQHRAIEWEGNHFDLSAALNDYVQNRNPGVLPEEFAAKVAAALSRAEDRYFRLTLTNKRGKWSYDLVEIPTPSVG